MPVDSGLAALSDQLLVLAICVYAVAMIAYVAQYAFGARGAVANVAAKAAAAKPVAAKTVAAKTVAKEPALVGAPASTTAAPEASEPEVSPARVRRLQLAARAAVALTVFAAALHAGSVLTRGLSAGRVPWGNMYEYISAVCLVGVVVWLLLQSRQPVSHLGGFVLLPVVLLLGLAGTVLYAESAPLIPALQSTWLKVHVSAAITASGVFLVGFATAGLHVLAVRFADRTAAGRTIRFPVTLGARLPSAETLERTAFRLHAFAFPIWTFAVIAGAIWAESAWGRYWGWDPKETWAFISWVVYAAYLHAQATAGWRGVRASLVAVLGGVTMVVNLFVVNLATSGLHSYAGL